MSPAFSSLAVLSAFALRVFETVIRYINVEDFYAALYHLTCLLRNLYAGQEATVRTGHGTTDWFQIGKGVRQGCILSPCLFNFYAEYIMSKQINPQK